MSILADQIEWRPTEPPIEEMNWSVYLMPLPGLGSSLAGFLAFLVLLVFFSVLTGLSAGLSCGMANARFPAQRHMEMIATMNSRGILILSPVRLQNGSVFRQLRAAPEYRRRQRTEKCLVYKPRLPVE